MRPLFFGESQHLYGVLNASETPAEWAVLVCPAIGQEMIRAHRAVRLACSRLAKQGADVLRFDYFGMGDSMGEDREGTPERWLEDIRAAADVLRAHSNARQLAILGLRVGGLLALSAQVRAVRRVILWDPVLDARRHHQELEKTYGPFGRGDWLVDGLPLTEPTRISLEALSSAPVTRVPRDIRIVYSTLGEGERSRVADLEEAGARVHVEVADSEAAWREQAQTGAGAVPTDVLNVIESWIR